MNGKDTARSLLEEFQELRGTALQDALQDLLLDKAFRGNAGVCTEFRMADRLIGELVSKPLDTGLERRLRRASGKLLAAWRLGRDPESYFVDLVSLAALLNPAQLRPKLTGLLVGGQGRGRDVRVRIGATYGNIDLHLHILRGLVGQHLPRTLTPVLRNDLHDVRYCAVAYALLAQMSIANIGKFFLPVLEAAAASPTVLDLGAILREVVLRRLAHVEIYRLLKEVAPSLGSSQQRVLERTLANYGWSISLVNGRYWVVSAPGKKPAVIRLLAPVRPKDRDVRVGALLDAALEDYNPGSIRREVLAALVPEPAAAC